MTVGGTALISDHVWLLDQRDVLKTASDAAGVATTSEMARLTDTRPDISDADLEAALAVVARRYVELNLAHLPAERLAQAKSTLVVEVDCDRRLRMVEVSAEADLGGTLLSRHMALFGDSAQPQAMRVASLVEGVINPIEIVLAIDITASMAEDLQGDPPCRGCDAPPDSRITVVKRGAASLVDILEPDADNRIAIGVVPWHDAVRLAPDAATKWNANGWARYPTRRVYGEPYSCSNDDCTPPPPAVEQTLASAAPEPWHGCLDSHRMGAVGGTHAALPATREFFTPPSSSAFAQRFFPSVKGASYECLAKPLPPDMQTQICFHGRRHTVWSNNRGWDPHEPQYGCAEDSPTILPLTNDGREIRRAIDSLAIYPNILNGLATFIGIRTYSPLGVLWGQRLLDHGWRNAWGGDVHPISPDAPENEGLRKVIVLLTDGEDNQCGRNNPGCADSAVGFSRADACTAAKAAGTEIFVIAAMHPDQVSQALGDSLRACSSESDNPDGTYAFLNNATPENLEAAFAEITRQLITARRLE